MTKDPVIIALDCESARETDVLVASLGTSAPCRLRPHGVGQVMRAAIEGRGDSNMKLLAVAVLTSFDQNDIVEPGYDCALPDLVAQRVRLAMRIGIDGIVGSPLEARATRAVAGPNALLVTPGVRSRGAAAGDRKRVATPAEALANGGAHYVVIGRRVTRSSDPAAALAAIHAELEESALTTSPR